MAYLAESQSSASLKKDLILSRRMEQGKRGVGYRPPNLR